MNVSDNTGWVDDPYAPRQIRDLGSLQYKHPITGVQPLTDVRPFPKSLRRAAVNDVDDKKTIHDALDGLARDLDQHMTGGATPPPNEDPMAALDRLRPTLLQEVAAVLVSLPFGEMMELTAGIAIERGAETAAADKMALATQIHAWAKKVNGQDRGEIKQSG